MPLPGNCPQLIHLLNPVRSSLELDVPCFILPKKDGSGTVTLDCRLS